MKHIIVVCFMLSSCGLFAQSSQEWIQRYNGPGNSTDITRSMVTDPDGNVYVTGVSNTGGSNTDYATVKYNSSGTFQWVARYFGSGSSQHLPVVNVDASGNVYVGGRVFLGSATQYDYVTIKYNSSGVQQWASTYNGTGTSLREDDVKAITSDGNGNVYVTGESWGDGTSIDIVTIKYNSSGASQWVSRYNRSGSSEDTPYAIKVDAAGNVYVAGASTDNFADCVTLKYNSSGVQQWASIYGVPAGHDKPYGMDIDDQGNVYIAGYGYNGSAGTDYITVKYNSSGSEMWSKKYNGPGNATDEAYSIAVDNDGNVFVTGFSEGSGSSSDYATVKYGADGAQLWASRYNGPGNSIDNASMLILDNIGNAYVTGSSTGTGSSQPDFATLKYDPSGAEVWIQRHSEQFYANAYSIGIDAQGKIYVAGVSDSGSSFQDYTIIKYSQTIGIQQISSELPDKFFLSQNYPNPFNPSTKIKFEIPGSAFIKLAVYDITGKETAVLVNDQLKAGIYEYTFNAEGLTSGVYFYTFLGDGITETKKMLLLK